MNATSGMAIIFPAMRWYGWRPPFLDHRAEDRGKHVVLVLEREGDTGLMPCAMISYCDAFNAWHDLSEVDTLRCAWGHGAHTETLDLAVRQLEADGWHVTGRLLIEFVGVWAEDDFWKQVHAILSKGSEGI